MPQTPSLTQKWHSKSYPSIDTKRPELSAKGKVILVTGGGGSIGRATALAFAQAGASKIAVVGRREEPLQETKRTIESQIQDVEVVVQQGDLSDGTSMQTAFKSIAEQLGKIDILIANAGYLSKFGPLADADADEWWRGFEINTKGAFNTVRAFLPVAATNATIVDVSSCVVHLPGWARASGYVASKLAGTKIYEIAGVENPSLAVFHLHPGVVHSDLQIKSGVTVLDDVDLPANFIVWLTSPEARFLRGKYLWCNWDVDEMRSRQEELQQPDQLTITINGWPLGQDIITNAPEY